MPSPRLFEARSIITHGLSEAGEQQHEAYMADFRRMVQQIERLYAIWLIDRWKGAELATDAPFDADPKRETSPKPVLVEMPAANPMDSGQLVERIRKMEAELAELREGIRQPPGDH